MGIVPPGKCWLLFSSLKKNSICRKGKQLFSHWLLSHGKYISHGKYFMSNSGCEQLCAPCQLLVRMCISWDGLLIHHTLHTDRFKQKKNKKNAKNKQTNKRNLSRNIPLRMISKILNFQIMRNYYILASVNFVWRIKADVSTFFKEQGKVSSTFWNI